MHEIESDWITAMGLRAVCLWVQNSHRCGYVEVPVSHPLYGIEYSAEAAVLKRLAGCAIRGPVGKRGIIPIFCASRKSVSELATPEFVFDVHGSLTFSGNGGEGYPVQSDGWWFGFDCAHAGDGVQYSYGPSDGEPRSLDYVADECEKLAVQLMRVRLPFAARCIRQCRRLLARCFRVKQ